MKQNFLQLNSSKTEAILVSTPYEVGTLVITSITFSGQDIPLSTLATNLGVRMDSYLTLVEKIAKPLSPPGWTHRDPGQKPPKAEQRC